MQYFWTPAEQLPSNVGFSLYGIEHLIWLAVLCAMCIITIVSYRRMNAVHRKAMVWAFPLLLLILEVMFDVYMIVVGAWQWRYLPLHPCSFTMFFMALHAWKPRKFYANVLYGYGLIGGLAALLFCNWTAQPIWHFQTIHSFIYHGILIAWILMLMLTGELVPQGRGFIDCMIFFAFAVPLTSLVNNTLPGCNFFFTHEGSGGSPLEVLINLMGKPWWLAGYVALVAVVIGLEFLPWFIRERKNNAATKK